MKDSDFRSYLPLRNEWKRNEEVKKATASVELAKMPLSLKVLTAFQHTGKKVFSPLCGSAVSLFTSHQSSLGDAITQSLSIFLWFALPLYFRIARWWLSCSFLGSSSKKAKVNAKQEKKILRHSDIVSDWVRRYPSSAMIEDSLFPEIRDVIGA